MGFRGSTLLLPLVIIIGTALAQESVPQSTPTQEVKIVRVRTGSYAGICSGYCEESTIQEPGSIRWTARAFKHRWMHPDRNKKGKLTEEEWQNLKKSIDEKVLKAFVGSIGCPRCTDAVVVWITVEFSDGTKKSVSFGEGDVPGPPAEITTLLQELNSTGPSFSRLPGSGPNTKVFLAHCQFSCLTSHV